MYDDQLFTVIKRDTCMAYPTCSLMLYFCCGVCWVRSMPVGINYYSDARFRIDAHETDALWQHRLIHWTFAPPLSVAAVSLSSSCWPLSLCLSLSLCSPSSMATRKTNTFVKSIVPPALSPVVHMGHRYNHLLYENCATIEWLLCTIVVIPPTKTTATNTIVPFSHRWHRCSQLPHNHWTRQEEKARAVCGVCSIALHSPRPSAFRSQLGPLGSSLLCLCRPDTIWHGVPILTSMSAIHIRHVYTHIFAYDPCTFLVSEESVGADRD